MTVGLGHGSGFWWPARQLSVNLNVLPSQPPPVCRASGYAGRSLPQRRCSAAMPNDLVWRSANGTLFQASFLLCRVLRVHGNKICPSTMVLTPHFGGSGWKTMAKYHLLLALAACCVAHLDLSAALVRPILSRPLQPAGITYHVLSPIILRLIRFHS